MTRPRPTRAEIVAMAAAGATNADIAHALGVTARTFQRDRARDPEFNAANRDARTQHAAATPRTEPAPRHVLTPAPKPLRVEIEQARARGWTLERTSRELAADEHQVLAVWSAMDDAAAGADTLAPLDDGVDEIAVERIMTGSIRPGEHVDRAERGEAVRRLAAAGFNDTDIGQRVGLTASGVFMLRKRAGIPTPQPRPDLGTGLRWTVPGRARRAS